MYRDRITTFLKPSSLFTSQSILITRHYYFQGVFLFGGVKLFTTKYSYPLLVQRSTVEIDLLLAKRGNIVNYNLYQKLKLHHIIYYIHYNYSIKPDPWLTLLC
jgi:hypothetical protein